MSKKFDYSKHPRMIYIVEEHVYLYAKLAMTIGFGSSSSIQGSDETLGYQSLPLSHVCLIKDRALRFCHILREEEASCDLVHPIVNRRLRFLDGSSNVGRYNSSDERPGLILLIKLIIVYSDAATYPPRLSENDGLRLNVIINIDQTLVSMPRHLRN